MKKLIYIFLLISSIGCIKTSLDDQSNEIIPNYSITLDSIKVQPEMVTSNIILNDEEFVTAIVSDTGDINIINIMQSFENGIWGLKPLIEISLGSGQLIFFDKLNSNFIVGSKENSSSTIIHVLDQDYNILHIQDQLESFIDSNYNAIDSLIVDSNYYCSSSNEILLGGRVYTQNTNYSCVLSLDINLDPKWFKTYFEESSIADLTCLNVDSLLLLNQNSSGTDLIIDNFNGSAYHKYDLNGDHPYFGEQLFVTPNNIQISGTQNEIARLIELDIANASALINEVEIYPISAIKALYLSRDNMVVSGIEFSGNNNNQFTSELQANGSKWCHLYTNESYVKILDIAEMPGKGILVSSIVENNSLFLLHFIRIDEEGATFIDNYSENCI